MVFAEVKERIVNKDFFPFSIYRGIISIFCWFYLAHQRRWSERML